MSNDIRIRDQVTFRRRTTARPYLHTFTGTVTSVNDANATVLVGYALHVVALAELTKVSATLAVADDYTFAIGQAGDLGGVELA